MTYRQIAELAFQSLGNSPVPRRALVFVCTNTTNHDICDDKMSS